MIRVLICDDHAVVRAGLERLVATFEGIEVVGTAADGDQAVRLAAEHTPDVILMDLEMPLVDGIEATRRITQARPGAHVVILTSFSDRQRILQALDAGALGYLLKDATPADLASGIRAAARGELPLDPKVARTVLRPQEVAARITIAAGPAPDALSSRQREALALVAEGLPNKLIARRLGIAEKTVKAHLTMVFREIGVENRTQAAHWFRAQGSEK